jgi:hypothetical protein
MRQLSLIELGQQRFGNLNSFTEWLVQNNLSLENLDEVEKRLNTIN